MWVNWDRLGELAKTATREAMDVIQAKPVDAEKADTFDFTAMSFTGNTVTGSSKVAFAA